MKLPLLDLIKTNLRNHKKSGFFVKANADRLRW